ncbi:MAG: hypothetical protein ABSD74_14110 [Rhizomicrobium sp.]|jgi:hypothetical protein
MSIFDELFVVVFCAGLAAASVSGAAAADAKGAKQKSETYITWGDPGEGGGGTPLVKGYNAVDTPQTINCTNAAGCTIEIDSMVGVGYGDDGQWGICAVVDGAHVTTPPCFNQGSLTDYGIVTGNSRQNAQVSMGTHTVQTDVLVLGPAYLENWQSDYVLFTPSPN